MNNNLPEGIGPHEGKELELMLEGKKPLAMFSDIIPASFDWGENRFNEAVENGRIVKREKIIKTPDNLYFRMVYFALPEEKWRIDKLHAIQEDIYTKHKTATKADDIEIGRLLGYSEEHIQIFIKRTWGEK